MGKYDPLTAYLAGLGGREVRMSFADIERVLGIALPEKSKAVRAWWSNNPSNNVMTKAWLAAGYKTQQVDVSGETLTFVPSNAGSGFAEMAQARYEGGKKVSPPPSSLPSDSTAQTPTRHPAWGVWKGLVTLDPDYDYTLPADPDWGKVYDE